MGISHGHSTLAFVFNNVKILFVTALIQSDLCTTRVWDTKNKRILIEIWWFNKYLGKYTSLWIRTVTNRFITLLNEIKYRPTSVRADLNNMWIILWLIFFDSFDLYLLVLIHFWVNINQHRWTFDQSQKLFYKLTPTCDFIFGRLPFWQFLPSNK